jgi:hypothetical protein
VSAAADLGMDTVGVFLAIDHDAVTNRRWHVANYPSVQRKAGSIPLRLDTRSPESGLMSFSPRPDFSRAMLIRDALAAAIDYEIVVARKLRLPASKLREERLERLNELWYDVLEAYERSSSSGAFTATLLSRIVNLRMGLDTVFLPSTRILMLAQHHIAALIDAREMLIDHHARVSAYLAGFQGNADRPVAPERELSVWLVCRECHTRSSVNPENLSRGQIIGTCSQCGRLMVESTRRMRDGRAVDLVVPRVLLDDVLDSVAVGAIGGCGYLGNAQHALMSNGLMVALGLPFSESLWSPRGSEPGLTEACLQWPSGSGSEEHSKTLLMLLNGTASVAHNMIDHSLESVTNSWKLHLSARAPHDFFEASYDVGWPEKLQKSVQNSRSIITGRIEAEDADWS